MTTHPIAKPCIKRELGVSFTSTAAAAAWLCMSSLHVFGKALQLHINQFARRRTFHLDLMKRFFICSDTDAWMSLLSAVLPEILSDKQVAYASITAQTKQVAHASITAQTI